MLSRIPSCLALFTVALLAGPASAQHFPVPVLVDGDTNVDNLGVVDNVDKVNVSPNGIVAVSGDDEGTAVGEEFLYAGGAIVIRDGSPLAGSGTTLDVIDGFVGYRHVNSAGAVVYTGSVTGGDTVLAVDGTMILRDLQAAGGISGRFYNDFLEPSITDSGDLYVEVDLDGAVTDDEVIYLVSGGAATPLAMNAGTDFREGSLIIGGPLDGETWDATAFTNSTANNLGTFIVDGNLDEIGGTSIVNDDVLVRKRVGFDYEVLLRGGDLLSSTLTGMAPFESITDITLADANNDWAIYGLMDDAVTTAANDSVVVAGIGGAAATIIAQEGGDVSGATGIPGTTMGTISGACVNSNGKVLILATVNDNGVDIPPYDEALFVWDAGVFTLIHGDNLAIPARPGEDLTDIVGTDVVINDQDRIFYQGTTSVGAADGIFEAVLPLVLPVQMLACSLSMAGTEVIATWSLPAGPAYDGIRVRVNGALVATLGGTATAFTTATFTQNLFVTIEVEPFVGVDSAPVAACNATINSIPADFIECSTPMPPPAIDNTLPPVVDVLPSATNVALLDLAVSLDITHTFQGDLDIDLSSPLGTNVVLTTDNGGTLDNVNITFADYGQPLTTTTDLASGLIVRPEGPGAMADFNCELSGGNWTLQIVDDAGGDTGVLNQWCLNIFEEPNPGLDCCPRPTNLLCSNVGACGGPGVNLSWSTNFAYDLLELVRDDGVGVTTIALSPSATSYLDTSVVAGTTYDYALRYRCAAGGSIQVASSCSVAVDSTTVPPVAGLLCVPNPCGAPSVAISWTNGAVYTSLTLNRAGVFLADVTGMTSFTDTMPITGGSSYSLIADCSGSTVTTNCTADLSPPAVTNLVCAADFCANTVSLSWDNNGLNYDMITLNRAGVFLADVTGMSSFVDAMPVQGSATYSVIASCNGAPTQTNCAVSNVLELPSDLMCGAPLGADSVNLTWTNPLAYTSIQIERDGVLVSPQPGPSDTSYTDTGLAQGAYTYTITFACAGGSDSLSCTVGVITGTNFLFIGRDGGTPDGLNIHDPTTGDFLGSFRDEQDALELYVVTNAIVGPRVPGGDDVVYVADQTGIDNGSIVRYELDGTFIGQYVDDTPFDDVRSVEFRGDTLFFTSNGATVSGVVSYDIGTLTATNLIPGGGPTDIEFLMDGSFLVSDWDTDSVTHYDPNGLNPVVLVSPLNSTMADPNQIAPLANGNFVVGTEGTGSDEIIEFTLAGVVVQSFPVGFNVQGVHQLPSGLVLFTTDAGTGVFTLDLTSGTITNVYSSGTIDFYYIEEVGSGPVMPTEAFIRGNCNGLDAGVNIADAVYLLGNLFPGAGTPNVLNCRDACDANDDGNINIADAVALLGSLFGSPAVPLPAPNGSCGADPTNGDALDCAINTPSC
ncbi:MAG: proprotein convertase P-domain-containing protein [Planctomycetota bacterium]